jgi:hypothetical protein
MSDHRKCERLLRIIASETGPKGTASVRTVERLYGEGFEEAWIYARNRFYLQMGGEAHLLSLSDIGRLALGENPPSTPRRPDRPSFEHPGDHLNAGH